MKQAVVGTADAVYQSLNSTDQDRVRDIFMRLTRLDASFSESLDARVARWRLRLDELTPATADGAETRALVNRLTDVHLLVTGLNPTSDEVEVKVASEALVRFWPRLLGWLSDSKSELELLESVRTATRDWARHHDPACLWHRGKRLTEDRRLNAHLRIPLSQLEQEYLDACARWERTQRFRIILYKVAFSASIIQSILMFFWLFRRSY